MKLVKMVDRYKFDGENMHNWTKIENMHLDLLKMKNLTTFVEYFDKKR